MVSGESKCLLSSLSSFQGLLMIASLYLLLQKKESVYHLGFYGGAPAPSHLFFCFLSTALVCCKCKVKEHQ